MAELTKEQALQEALIGWVLGGGTCHGLFVQMELFVDALTEMDNFQDGGARQQALQRLLESLDEVQRLALKADGTGIPELPPHLKPAAPAPVKVLVVVSASEVAEVRASVPVQVSIWERGEVREGFVPTALLDLPVQPIVGLVEDDLPAFKVIDGVKRWLAYDRRGRALYVKIPEKE